jgi:hypothetical protein
MQTVNAQSTVLIDILGHSAQAGVYFCQDNAVEPCTLATTRKPYCRA